MNADDLKETIEAIMLRNDGRWCTPSGAFLDLLRQFAKDEKIGEIASACEIYFSSYRGAQAYVASALPAIILNNYKPLTAGVDFSKFLRWAEQNPDWSDRIRDHACSTDLPYVVDEMQASLQRF